jgi:hypothetical protein
VTSVLGRGRRAAARVWRRLRGTYRTYPVRAEFLRFLPLGGVGAELGVFRGEFSRSILEVTQPRELHLVDCWWLLYGERYPDWGPYTDHGRLETRRAYAEVMDLATKFAGATGTVVHVCDAAEYLAAMPASYFDWVYLDTSHEYEQSRRELAAGAMCVKAGGLITGHDWQEDSAHPHHGLCRAIREFCHSRSWRIVHLDNHSQWAIQRRQ